jgi:hypothetical protein
VPLLTASLPIELLNGRSMSRVFQDERLTTDSVAAGERIAYSAHPTCPSGGAG